MAVVCIVDKKAYIILNKNLTYGIRLGLDKNILDSLFLGHNLAMVKHYPLIKIVLPSKIGRKLRQLKKDNSEMLGYNTLKNVLQPADKALLYYGLIFKE